MLSLLNCILVINLVSRFLYFLRKILFYFFQGGGDGGGGGGGCYIGMQCV